MIDTIEKDLQEAKRRLDRVESQYERKQFREVPVLERGKEFEWDDDERDGVEEIKKVWVNEDGTCRLEVANEEMGEVESVDKNEFLRYVESGELVEV